QVSRATAELDPMLEAWRNRPIPSIAHLILDARYEKVRVDGIVRSCAVFTAIGIQSFIFIFLPCCLRPSCLLSQLRCLCAKFYRFFIHECNTTLSFFCFCCFCLIVCLTL
ncbi:MAG: transposase, partial [Chthoniobacterales bacterium]|nr:transposase [Chthoniobacterales bacterium]